MGIQGHQSSAEGFRADQVVGAGEGGQSAVSIEAGSSLGVVQFGLDQGSVAARSERHDDRAVKTTVHVVRGVVPQLAVQWGHRISSQTFDASVAQSRATKQADVTVKVHEKLLGERKENDRNMCRPSHSPEVHFNVNCPFPNYYCHNL